MKSKFVLFIIFILCTAYFSLSLRNSGFHLLSYDQIGQKQEIVFSEGLPLLSGEKVTIETKAQYNNLGNILVRFTNGNRDGGDQLIFKIIDKDTDKELYSALYNTDQFLPDKLFPFGFEPIQNSAGRNYTVIIESTRGSSESGTYISTNKPIFIFRTVLSKDDLIKNPRQILSVLTSKIKFIVSSQETIRSLILAYVPLLLYTLFLVYSNSSYTYQILVFILSSGIILQLRRPELDYHLTSITLYWLLLSIKRNFPDIATLVLSLSYFILAFVLSTLTDSGLSNSYFSLSLLLFASFHVLRIFYSQKIDKKRFDSFLNSLNDFNRERGVNSANIISLLGKIVFYAFLFNKLIGSIRQLLYAPAILENYPRLYGKEVSSIALFALFATLLYKAVMLIFIKLRNSLFFYPLLFVVVNLYIMLNGHTYSFLVGHTIIPKIVALSPKSTSEAWVDVTITGKNFQDLPFVGKVTLAGEVQVENVWFWSNEKIIFRTNPATTKTGDVCVITLSKGNSNCLPFTYNFGK